MASNEHEDMEIDDPDDPPNRRFTLSAQQSVSSSNCHLNPLRWSFYGEEITFAKKCIGSNLKSYIDTGDITVNRNDRTSLTISCVSTSTAKIDIIEIMGNVEKAVSLLRTHKASVNINTLLPSSFLEKIESYIMDRDNLIEDGLLLIRKGYIEIYGFNSSVLKREQRKIEDYQRMVEADYKMNGSQQTLGSSGTDAGGSSYKRGSKLTAFHHAPLRPPLFRTTEGIEVYVYNHSITDLHTDAIVNAANEELKHHGGVAKAIADRAGANMEYECRSYVIKKGGRLSVTENFPTKVTGNLQTKNVIHAVGPRWDSYPDKEHCLEDLCWTIIRALETASSLECVDIGMPAISAGIFGVPKVLCAKMYIRGIIEHSKRRQTSILQVHIVDVDDKIVHEIDNAYREYQKDPTSIEPKKALQRCSYVNKVQATGKSSSRNGETKSHYWLHDTPSRIHGLQDAVENFISNDGMFTVKIYTGSIVRVKDVDAILCSADNTFTGLGYLGMALRTAGGWQYEKNFDAMGTDAFRSNSFVGKCDAAGSLKVRCVVHAVIDSFGTASYENLQKYKKQVRTGLNKVETWRLKSIAMPLVGAGFVEKNQHDMERVCEVMHKLLTDFYREEKPRVFCEINLVNKNPNVTKSLLKHFKQNSVQVPSGHHHTTYSGSDGHKGARPKSASQRAWQQSANYDDSASHNAKYNQSSFNASTRHSRGNTSKPFSKTFHAASQQSVKGDSGDVKSLKREGNETTRFKETPKDVSISPFNGAGNVSSEQKGAGNTRLKQGSEPSQLRKGPVGNTLKQDAEMSATAKQKEAVSGRLKQSTLNRLKCESCYECSEEMARLKCGHSFCKIPCFLPMQKNRTCIICKAKDNFYEDGSSDEFSDGEDTVLEPKTDEPCVICMDDISNPMHLSCGHVFCKECITQSIAHKPACPICGEIFGKLKGDQPTNGNMKVERKSTSLTGYKGVGTIEIRYFFPSGIQQENHPRPGKPYKGTERRAYLPDNKEGQKVLRLLKKAFESRLTFTIGSSRTTGQDDVVTWNDIHHKTKRDGGSFGYPDPTYLMRVQEELAAKGIKE
ncbi:uncharacterized protein [Argopecten irradians]|uniref:uncharacterized protein n=1 Tax=Argopecten irradians TaxID=31199 RepID=UPI00371CA6E0